MRRLWIRNLVKSSPPNSKLEFAEFRHHHLYDKKVGFGQNTQKTMVIHKKYDSYYKLSFSQGIGEFYSVIPRRPTECACLVERGLWTPKMFTIERGSFPLCSCCLSTRLGQVEVVDSDRGQTRQFFLILPVPCMVPICPH